MRHPFQKRSLIVCALVSLMAMLAYVQQASANVFTDINPNPLPNLMYGTTNIGSLQITQYAQNNPVAGNIGATIEAQFNQTFMPTCNLNLQWVQVITGGKGTIGQTLAAQDNVADPIPYLDPYQRDDNLPYYWTNPENSTVGDGKINAGSQPGTHLFDMPSQSPTNGNFINFESALVAVSPTNPMNLIWLAGFTWGYSIAGGVSTANPFAWTNGPSNAMNSAVTDWDGTQLYVGDGNDTMQNNAGGGIGYKFVANNMNPVWVPEPGSAGIIFAIGIIGFASARPRRLRAA